MHACLPVSDSFSAPSLMSQFTESLRGCPYLDGEPFAALQAENQMHDNFRLFLYLILRGRCALPEEIVSDMCFLEGVDGILWVASYLAFGLTLCHHILFGFAAFIILAMIDIDTLDSGRHQHLFLALLG